MSPRSNCLYTSTAMKESEVSTPSSVEVGDETSNAEAGRAPAVVVRTSKLRLWEAFIIILCSRYIMLLIDGKVMKSTPHAMSNFSESAHRVLSFSPIVVGMLSGILRIPMAKMIDNYGRGPGLVMAWCTSFFGLMILGCFNSLANTVVGQILYGIGSSWIDFIFTVILADLTSLKNRALIYGIYTIPVIFTTSALTPWQKTFPGCILLLLSIVSPLLSMFMPDWVIPGNPDVEEADTTTSKQQPSPATRSLWHLMTDKNLLAGCLVVMLTAASTAFCGHHYSSYLQVVNDETSITATQITNTRIVAFAVSAPFIGFLIRVTGHYRLPALLGGTILVAFISLPLFFYGQEHDNVLQFLQMGSGTFERLLIACSQMAVLANVDHENVAMALGIWGAFLSIAGSMGASFSTVVWTKGLPGILYKALPTDSKSLMAELICSLEKQKQYPLGNPIRDAVAVAYEELQGYVVITAQILVSLALVCIFAWKNIDVRKGNDVQGARAKGVVW